MDFNKGQDKFNISDGHFAAIFILAGEIVMKQEKLSMGDFLVFEDEKEFDFTTIEIANLFLIEVPKELSYKRFADSGS